MHAQQGVGAEGESHSPPTQSQHLAVGVSATPRRSECAGLSAACMHAQQDVGAGGIDALPSTHTHTPQTHTQSQRSSPCVYELRGHAECCGRQWLRHNSCRQGPSLSPSLKALHHIHASTSAVAALRLPDAIWRPPLPPSCHPPPNPGTFSIA